MSDKPFEAGDRVTVFRRGEIRRTTTVERTTRTMVFLKGDLSKYRHDGEKIGPAGDFEHGHIERTTDEHVSTLRRLIAVARLKDFDWGRLPMNQINHVHDLVKTFLNEERSKAAKEGGGG